MPPAPDEPLRDEIDPLLAAARDLIDQVEGSGYRDKHGHPLENNEAFIELKSLFQGYG